MITNDSVRSFLDGHRIAVIGASERKDAFARTIDQALVDHGYEVVLAINGRLAKSSNELPLTAGRSARTTAREDQRNCTTGG